MTSILWIFSMGFSAGGPIRLKLFSAEGREQRTSDSTDKTTPSSAGVPKFAIGTSSALSFSSLQCHHLPLPSTREHALAFQVGSFCPHHTTKGMGGSPLHAPVAPLQTTEVMLPFSCQAESRQVCVETAGTK